MPKKKTPQIIVGIWGKEIQIMSHLALHTACLQNFLQPTLRFYRSEVVHRNPAFPSRSRFRIIKAPPPVD